MTEKQQQLLFDKGITNVPSDVLCSDNTLAESVGMVYDNGEHRVIQKPAEYITSAQTRGGIEMDVPVILYIHKFNNEERYIGWVDDDNPGGYLIVWGSVVDKVFHQKGYFVKPDNTFLRYTIGTSITSIGKTLIIPSYNTIYYFLWSYDSNNNATYDTLGNSYEGPSVEFRLTGRNDNKVKKEISSSGVIYYDSGRCQIALNQQENWNNTVIGLFSEVRKKIWQKKLFSSSFCVRAALELYDGTFYLVSNPVFMLNHFSAYCTVHILGSGGVEDPKTITMKMYGQELEYKFSQDYSKWSDIIRNVVLFVTREENLFDTGSDATLILRNGKKNPLDPEEPDIPSSTPVAYFMSGNSIYADSEHLGSEGTSEGDLYRVLDSNPDSDLENAIKSGVYYKLCNIGITGDGEFHKVSDIIDTHYIENLTTQQRLEEDDYFSHCPLKAETLYAYNSRLNLANVSRGFFKGFVNFMPFDGSEESTYWFHVTIKTDGGQVVIQNIIRTRQKQGIYFYYPDPRAKHVDIYKGEIGSTQTQVLDQDLTEHPSLNGAYYFAGVSPTMDEPVSPTTHTTSATVPEPYESLANYVLTSETNNPFVFKASGYFKVGTGKIIGMSTITQALSQGQFGQFPLLVFSESGIWALSVASTGYYSSVHPMSREVCNNANSITQTDGAVFFSSNKGLMVIVGNSVKCVSEQLGGKESSFPFVNFLKNAVIAYDYRDSLLWIFANRNENAWIYNIKSGTFSTYELHLASITVANNYPDFLIQNGNNVYSLMKREDINLDDSTYYGTLETRPMKFENGLALKSIMGIKHIHDMNKDATLTLQISASNNLKNWVTLNSLRGTPWKYYRFKYTFANLKATDRFAGTVIVTQERRTDKLR